jgi:dTDP-4-amino-4,6-dideoxygalactose transaminase
VGARPVFVDIDPATRNIDLELGSRPRSRPRTRAIIPVDLAGLPGRPRPASTPSPGAVGLRVVEDAAQAHGRHRGAAGRSARTGDFRRVCSFHANKNVTSIEGGALVLPPDADAGPGASATACKGVARRSGPDGMKMDVDLVGGKSNLTDVAARVGLGQLRRPGRIHRAPPRSWPGRYLDRVRPHPRLRPCQLPTAEGQLAHVPGRPARRSPRRRACEPSCSAMAARRASAPAVPLPRALHLFTLYRALGCTRRRRSPAPSAWVAGSATAAARLPWPGDDVERVCTAAAEADRRAARAHGCGPRPSRSRSSSRSTTR